MKVFVTHDAGEVLGVFSERAFREWAHGFLDLEQQGIPPIPMLWRLIEEVRNMGCDVTVTDYHE